MKAYDLSRNTKIRVSGPESLDMLNNLVTNDVSRLRKGSAMHAAFLNRFGKVEADTWIYHFKDHYIVEANEMQHDKLLLLLKKYGVFSKVEIVDESKTPLFHVIGEKPANSFERKRTSEIGHDIFDRISAETLWNESLDEARIEAGIPEYGKDIDEKSLVVEGGFDDAIDYNKGCYIGQEIVARMKTFKGRTIFQVETFLVEGNEVPKPGEKVMKDGTEAGVVTSSVFSKKYRMPVVIARVKSKEGLLVNGHRLIPK